MYRTQIVLELLVLYVGISHSWNIAVAHLDFIEFYTNDVKSSIMSVHSFPRALAYDEVHDMLLYVDKQTNNDAIYGFDISANTRQCLLQRNGRNIYGLAFDPVTELLFFSDTKEKSISWISVEPDKPASNNTNLLVKLDDGIPTDIAVDSCRGYVYWINTNLPTSKIERVRFDGSEREVILDLNSLYTNSSHKLEPHSLVIDQVTQKMYWIEPRNSSLYAIYYADLKGENKTVTLYVNMLNYTFTNPASNMMTVSKTHLFVSSWCSDCETVKVLKSRKEEYAWGPKYFYMLLTNEVFSLVAKNQMRNQDIKNCEALTCLDRKNSVEPYCVHGEKMFGRCLCKCAPGYIGKRCDVSVCDNYCLQGSCSVNDEGLPKCRCHAGYSGERCGNSDGLYCVHGDKVIGQSVCKCAPGYIGERCDVSVCNNYCFHGNCSVNNEGLPKCRCDSGYSGERCETDACHGFCLNYGVCSLNEKDEPSCECVEGYEGSRCEGSRTR